MSKPALLLRCFSGGPRERRDALRVPDPSERATTAVTARLNSMPERNIASVHRQDHSIGLARTDGRGGASAG